MIYFYAPSRFGDERATFFFFLRQNRLNFFYFKLLNELNLFVVNNFQHNEIVLT